METSRQLTIAEIHQGILLAEEMRRLMVWHALKLAAFAAGCGLLLIGSGYLAGSPVSPWAFLLPLLLAAIVVPSPIREASHFACMAREFREAERTVIAGGMVRVQDVSSLARRPSA